MLKYRKATIADKIIYFNWANDPDVREQSYNSSPIDFDSHCKWFESKLEDKTCLMLVFQNEENMNIGQIRIQKENINEALIGISVSVEHRGNSYAKEMLQIASDYFLDSNPGFKINAFIKKKNLSSKHAFEKAGFEFEAEKNYENTQSFHYVKKLK
jgi:RimJ/RimL family protein N-acetyltransferase